jgi:D-erythro-7,8-dihydroneopterin triphosphate epimerase
MSLAKLRITDLLLRAVIGDNQWERGVKQDVVINITFEFDASKATASDALEDTVNYKTMKKKIIAEVESSSYRLLEKLTARVLGIVMDDDRVLNATVRIDKPHALRYAKSVSIEMSGKRESRH